MIDHQLWIRAAELLAEHRTEKALYAHIISQLALLVAAGHQEGVEHWRRSSGTIDQISGGATH